LTASATSTGAARAAVRGRTLLGVLTPSSNTVLEPLTAAMLQGLPDISAHFARFRVREISLGEAALGQFEEAPILDAARLLADARVGSIVWSGTSAGWRGFAADERLCRAITEATGAPAGSSVLALNEVFALTGVRRFGLVTPYLDEIQARIVENYAQAGYECVAEHHLGDPGNFSFSEVDEAAIARMIREVAAARPDAITVFCTNLRGARVAAALEAETGIPIYDTVATGLWQGLRLAGADPRRITGWGRLFALG
jgi:maleate isomerase